MGLFTSLCPGCLFQINWFIEAPNDYKCKRCNRPVSQQEIEWSFRNQVHDNPTTAAYLKTLSLEELKKMVEETKEKDVVRSPRPEDEFYVVSGHFYLLKGVYQEKQGERNPLCP